MAFRSANLAAHMVKFNSAVSADFLDVYSNLIDEEIKMKEIEPKHKTFAPSSMRCNRISWFRLRGVEPDKVKSPDQTLYFTAQVGTSCHESIQKRLQTSLGPDWIDVQTWIDENPEFFNEYEWTLTKNGYESMIDMSKPYPVRFACDGILKFQNKIRLLEIKTAESSSLADLIEPKSKHMDQIRCYSTLLHIPDVLFLYQDRTYGAMKCFEVQITPQDWEQVKQNMNSVIELVEANIAPEGLPAGDPDCNQNMCPYYKKCKEWGR